MVVISKLKWKMFCVFHSLAQPSPTVYLIKLFLYFIVEIGDGKGQCTDHDNTQTNKLFSFLCDQKYIEAVPMTYGHFFED